MTNTAMIEFSRTAEGIEPRWVGPTDATVHFSIELLQEHPDLIRFLPWDLEFLGGEIHVGADVEPTVSLAYRRI